MRTLDLSYDYRNIRHDNGEDHMEPTIKVWMWALEKAAGKLKGRAAARAAAELARTRQAKAQRMADDAAPPLRAIAGSLLMADELEEGFADSSATPCYAAVHSRYLLWRTTEGGALVAGLDLAGFDSSAAMSSVVGADGVERARVRVVGNDAAVGDDAEPELRSIDIFSNYLKGGDGASPSIEEWFEVLDAVKVPATSSPAAVASMTRAFAKLDLVEVEDALFPGGARSVSRATFCDAMTALAIAAGTPVDGKTLAFFFGAMAMLGGSDDHDSADIEVVTAALSTKCVANHEDVTEAVYRVFDTERTNTLTPAEIGRFLHTVLELTIRMKDCTMPYDAEHEEHASRFADAVTENMFRTIDTDGNGFIERDEFGEWLEERIAPGAKRKAAPKPVAAAQSSAATAVELDAMEAAHSAEVAELRSTLCDVQRELAEAKQGSAAALKSELAALRIQLAAQRAEWTRQTFEAQAGHAAELARLRDALHRQPSPSRLQREPLPPAAARPKVHVSRHGSIMVSQPVRASVPISPQNASPPVAIRAIRPAIRQPYGAMGGLSVAPADSARSQELLGRAINASQDAQRAQEQQELAEKAKVLDLRARQLEQQTQRADAAAAAATRRARAQSKELDYMRQRLGASEERVAKEREQSEALQRRLAGLGASSPSMKYALSPPRPRTSPVSEYRDSYVSPEGQRRSRAHSPYYPAQYELPQLQPAQVNVNRHGSVMISPSAAARSPVAARSPSPIAAAEQRSPLRSSSPAATMATLSPQPRPQYAPRSVPYQAPCGAAPAPAPAPAHQRARVNVNRNGSIVVAPARTPLGARVASRSPHNSDLLVDHSQRRTEALALLKRAEPLWDIARAGPSGQAREAYHPSQ
jgi:Ca2+-binding EF-hand superfamily protein